MPKVANYAISKQKSEVIRFIILEFFGVENNYPWLTDNFN